MKRRTFSAFAATGFLAAAASGNAAGQGREVAGAGGFGSPPMQRLAPRKGTYSGSGGGITLVTRLGFGPDGSPLAMPRCTVQSSARTKMTLGAQGRGTAAYQRTSRVVWMQAALAGPAMFSPQRASFAYAFDWEWSKREGLSIWVREGSFKGSIDSGSLAGVDVAIDVNYDDSERPFLVGEVMGQDRTGLDLWTAVPVLTRDNRLAGGAFYASKTMSVSVDLVG